MKQFKFLNLIIITLIILIINCSDEAGTEEEDEGSPPGSGSNLWPKRLGNTENDFGYDIKSDPAGNVYVTGYITDSADFNGDGIYSDTGGELSGWMQYADIFIVKYNSAGTYLWSKRLGGTGSDKGRKTAIDSDSNLYITGELRYGADLNGDNDSTDGGAESSAGFADEDIFIAKYDDSGAYQWSWRLGGASTDSGWGITTDSDNSVYLTGNVYGSAHMKGDVTDDTIALAAGYGLSDIIVVKYDSSGKYKWSRRLGGSSFDGGYGITAGLNDNIIVTGSVTGNVDFNGDGDQNDEGETAYSSTGITDIFIVKFDPEGVYQWSKRVGNLINKSSEAAGISSDLEGNFYLTGITAGNADLNSDGDYDDGGAESGTGYDGTDIIIAKFNSSGIYQWSKRLGGGYNDFGRGITTDPAGNVYATGLVVYNADLNGDGDSIDGNYEFTGRNDSDDIFIAKFNTSGIYQWSKRFSGSAIECGHSVAADSGGNAYITGYTRGDVDLNGDGDFSDNAESSAGYGEGDIVIIKVMN